MAPEDMPDTEVTTETIDWISDTESDDDETSAFGFNEPTSVEEDED